MNRNTFETRLRTAAQLAVDVARQYVQQPLLGEVAFLVYPNQSCNDNPLVGDEVVFPEESLPLRRSHGPWLIEQAAKFLWRGGLVPEWIDAAVESENRSQTFVGLLCCGRFTAQEDLLYHRRSGGVPPFAIKSPYLPPDWESLAVSGKFDLYWREQWHQPNQPLPR